MKLYNARNKYTKTTCDCCGIEFDMPSRQYRKYVKGQYNNKFCSVKCHNKYQSDHPTKEKHLVRKICKYCGNEYEVKPYLEHISKYCCFECKKADKKQQFVDVICDICGKMHTKSKVQFDKNTYNFCSKECKDYHNKEVLCKDEEFIEVLRANAVLGYQTIISKKGMTKPEQIVNDFLISKQIEFIPQYFAHNKFFLDFYLPKDNIVIEVFGDYWHGNPLLYGNETGLTPLHPNQIKQQKRDNSRLAYLRTVGYQVYVVWENDIYNNITSALNFL